MGMYEKETPERLLYSGLAYAMDGENPSKAIEDQEKRGQDNLIKYCCLPRVTSDHKVPKLFHDRGIKISDDFDERFKKMKSNNANYIKYVYDKLGIRVMSEEDDLFYNVELPEGWKIEKTDHSMWSNLIDNKGRKRASIFYKAAFYDRDAFIVFNTRFQLTVDHTADPEDPYDVWVNSNYQGLIKDGDNVIYKTEEVPPPGDYSKDNKVKDKLMKELKKHINQKYPNYEDILAYWEED